MIPILEGRNDILNNDNKISVGKGKKDNEKKLGKNFDSILNEKVNDKKDKASLKKKSKSNKKEEKVDNNIKAEEVKEKKKKEIKNIKNKILLLLALLEKIDKNAFIKFKKELHTIINKNNQITEKKDLNYLLKLLKQEISNLLKGKINLKSDNNNLKEILNKINTINNKDVNTDNKPEIIIEDKRKVTQKKAVEIKKETFVIIKDEKSGELKIKKDVIKPILNILKSDNNVTGEKLNIKSTPVLHKADITRLMEHIAQKAKITLSEGRSEVLIKLKPESLGSMLLKMEINDKGKLEGKIIVNNLMAHKVLKDNIAQLKVSFQEMGLEVTNFNVSLNKGFDFNNQRRNASLENDFNLKGLKGIGLNGNDEINEDLFIHNIAENYYLTDWLASTVNIQI